MLLNMNIFRFCGDMCHLFSIFILIIRLNITKNSKGVSLKTQELFLLVFISRYLDLFTGHWVSLYNTIMKLLYIGSTGGIVYVIREVNPWKRTYSEEVRHQDTFQHLPFCVGPAAAFAFLICFIGMNIYVYLYLSIC